MHYTTTTSYYKIINIADVCIPDLSEQGRQQVWPVWNYS